MSCRATIRRRHRYTRSPDRQPAAAPSRAGPARFGVQRCGERVHTSGPAKPGDPLVGPRPAGHHRDRDPPVDLVLRKEDSLRHGRRPSRRCRGGVPMPVPGVGTDNARIDWWSPSCPECQTTPERVSTELVERALAITVSDSVEYRFRHYELLGQCRGLPVRSGPSPTENSALVGKRRREVQNCGR